MLDKEVDYHTETQWWWGGIGHRIAVKFGTKVNEKKSSPGPAKSKLKFYPGKNYPGKVKIKSLN